VGYFDLIADFVMTTLAPSGFSSNTLMTGGYDAFMMEDGDKMRLTSFAPAAVPEPSRALLGALGFLGLVLRRRRSC
jgi:hypothetical protein